MSEPDPREATDGLTPTSLDAEALIASLRAAGAGRFDPVRLHYIEVLAKRSSTHQGSVKHMLEAKLTEALTAFKEGFEQALREANEIVERSAQQYPQASKDLQRLLDAGDFKGVRKRVASLETGVSGMSLGALVRELEQHAPDHAATRVESNALPRSELKTIRNFRKTWAKLSVDNQVAQALKQAPKNAGPINSHMLMLRSLAMMRDISPDYLNRFMSYADTLLCLDQGEKEKPALPKKPQATKSARK